MKRALVLGGTGAVGSAVLRELARRGVSATFSYHASEDRARALAAEYGHTALRVDLADPVATRAALDALATPDVAIHCAGVSSTEPFVELDRATWQRTFAVNVESAYTLCQWLASRGQPCDIVLVGGLDRAQSLPLPAHFAATQGALSALAMALGHELGPRGIRINLVALGVLDGGISTQLAARRKKDYETFSALRRAGKPDEAAKAIAWLALENTFIQGKVIPVNGGI
ncbi:MAG TPA: SDR family oxidoreductase [Kofleriaceae bacterium]|nr:SDR family oxidoreductase [Kofleriaceae bacterium]